MEQWLVVSIIIAAYLLLTLTIGLLAGRRSSDSVAGYVAADRSFGLLVMYFVTGASVFSAFAFLGGPGWAYSRGAAAFYILAYGALGMAPFYWMGPRAASLGRRHGYVTQAQLVTGRFPREAIPFLQNYVDLLPKGKVLDLAMGEGRNGVFLATQGFNVTGIDISKEGLKKAENLAAEQGASITTLVADLETYNIPPNTFDVIICTYYLQRDLFPKIAAALKPGGMTLIETYTMDHLQYRPRFNKAYLLEPNELLTMLPGLRVLRYQEVDTGQAAFASILAQKPQ